VHASETGVCVPRDKPQLPGRARIARSVNSLSAKSEAARSVPPQLYATRRLGQKVGSLVVLAADDLSTCSAGSAGVWSLALSLFCSTGFPYCQVPASIASFISSSRARIRHSRRSLSLRTRTPSAFAVSQSHATPSCAQRSFARPRIVASLISVTAETILAFNACRMGALVNGCYI
jgi:hypothetical protein